MIQKKRINTFETNSSSIHCLTVDFNVEVEKNLKELKIDIYPFKDEEICQPEIFSTLIEKLRYLWTIICSIEDFGGYDEQVDELKSMLRSIFPQVNFYYIEKVAYLEDFEDIFECNLIYNEDFIQKWLSSGCGYYLSRDYSWEDYEYSAFIDKVRSYINNDYTIWSEG